MVGPTDPLSVRRLRRWRFGVLALAGLLLGHTAVYVVAYGDGARLAQAMTAGGHDGYWTMFAGAALAGLAALAGDGALGLWRAWRPTRHGRPSGPSAGREPAPDGPDYLTELLDLWGPLFVVVGVGFLVQENIETMLVAGRVPLLGVYTAHLLAAPLLALVTGLLAAIGALVRWEIAVLARCARRSTARWDRPSPRRPDRRWSVADPRRPARWALLRADIGRAPPAPSAVPA